MSTEVLIKGLFAAFLSIAFAWMVLSRHNAEQGSGALEADRQRYLPYVSGAVFPAVLLALVAMTLIISGTHEAARMTLSMCFGIFLHISLYYTILILMLPLLRRHISARACAVLWMLPNYLYYTLQSYMRIPRPFFILHAPGRLTWILFYVWLAGFFAVLIWKTAVHLLFRHYILKDAAVITDREILELWDHEIGQARIKHADFRLVTSPNVTTPLSIGLFRRTTQVVLPIRHYTPEELSLIFRHEIIHIGREDAWSKFFLVFCTAMCWFNPLMWIAARKSADDLELSCDETVLLDTDDDTRRRYAELILDTAGNERGFTTCLSASAAALRYRLKHIVKPQKQYSGALTVGLTFFILCMSCGYVALAYDGGTGAEIIYRSEDPRQYSIRYITRTDPSPNLTFRCTDEPALHEYLAGMELENLTGNYSFTVDTREEKQFVFTFDTPDGILGMVLSDHMIKLAPLWSNSEASYFYLPEGADWEYLDTLLTASSPGL